MEMIGTVFSVLIGGGILTFVQFLISRHDNKKDKQKEILASINSLRDEVAQVKLEAKRQNAVLARTHILRFADELYNGVHHSREYFEQTLDDINTYSRFCDTDPEFKNGRTVAAAQYIIDTYNKLIEEHKL